MSWSNILVPVLGGVPDAQALAAGRGLAAPFAATVTAAYSFLTPAALFPWTNEFGVGASDVAIEELERAADAGEAAARRLIASLAYPHTAFEKVTAENGLDLRAASRLADVVVWHPATVHGRGFFAAAFQQILIDERRPALIATTPPKVGGLVVIAWDGGREASRAARRAVPWLQQADQVIVLTVPRGSTEGPPPDRILRYLAGAAVPAEPMVVRARRDPAAVIVETARRLGARMLVAGAFGHTRLQRFLFGGATEVLLESPSVTPLFLSH
jgi:nucleotide-binding universal stress UspA family protein